MSDEEKKVTKKPERISEVKLRSYPKVIFFYPLLFTSLILWIIQIFFPEPVPALGYIWMIVFFCNIFVIAFDFNSAKFFILVLIIVVVVLLLIFFVPWSDIFASPTTPTEPSEPYNIGLQVEFYMIMTIILAIILAFVILSSQFDYWKVERNEIYHKSGIFANAERFPVKSLRFKKEIPDVFEFIALRAGSVTLIPTKDKVIHLNTVLNINNKAEQLDYLLSHLHVEVDELD